MEPKEIEQLPELRDRVQATLDTLLNRALGSLSGLERTIVNQGALMLYPRVQRRVREASAEQLRDELVYFHSLIDAALGKQAKKPAKPPMRRRNSRRRTASPAARGR